MKITNNNKTTKVTESVLDKNERILSVSQINRISKNILEDAFPLIWVKGEVSNLVIHYSGHVYFILKDDKAQINCTFFKGARYAKEIELKNGAEVNILGQLTIYAIRGQFQINVKDIRLTKSLGSLLLEFEKLKEQLKKEGLFATERKKSIPLLPKTIGVITSPNGAAIHDFLNIINRRFANINIKIFPTAVQGSTAAKEIIQGIKFFNIHKLCDVLIITRGGGSIEDLWPFNNERLARIISESKIPIISAVGHEVDFTICDLVADLRVPTPSAAAELVIGKKNEFNEYLNNIQKKLLSNFTILFNSYKYRLEKTTNSYVFREPANLIKTYNQKLDELVMRKQFYITKLIEKHLQKLDSLSQKLKILDPHNILKRGYSILISDNSGKAITRTKDVNTNDSLTGILADGQIKLKVLQNKIK